MLSKFYTFLLLITFSSITHAQVFLNGSFENTTSTGCDYNLNNAAFNSRMSDVTAYGGGNETDIMEVGCYVPTIPDGIRCVALASANRDELAMALATPLVAGTAYTFTFYAYCDIQFRPLGNVEIGASTANNSFGSLIYTGITIANTWVQYSVSFVAPNNTTHITMRNAAGATHWNRLDGFNSAILLPVQIQKFTATLVNQQVQLDWETEQEKNSDYFLIERSLDGLEWETIGQVAAAGNSTTLNEYQLYDKQPNVGVNYYRIKEFDYNGNAMVSDIRAVDYQINQEASIAIYPNPTKDKVTISLLVPQTAVVNIEVYDMAGRKLLEKANRTIYEGLHQEEVDLSELGAGVYILKISSNTLRYGMKKIIKQ